VSSCCLIHDFSYFMIIMYCWVHFFNSNLVFKFLFISNFLINIHFMLFLYRQMLENSLVHLKPLEIELRNYFHHIFVIDYLFKFTHLIFERSFNLHHFWLSFSAAKVKLKSCLDVWFDYSQSFFHYCKLNNWFL
jgi:hypothetical protein